MGHRSTEQPPIDDIPGLQEFRAALEGLTGDRHPIYSPVGPEHDSICAILYATAIRGLLERDLTSLPDPVAIVAAPDQVLPAEPTPIALVDWIETTFSPNTKGVLHRLSCHPHTPELKDAVHLAVFTALRPIVYKRYWGYPSSVREDLCQHLFAKHFRRWVKAYDPTLANLNTFLARRVGPKAVSRHERVSLGLEPEISPPTDAEDRARDREDDAEQIREILRTPEAADEVFRDRYIHDRSNEEIAKKHGLTPGAVRARISRLIAKIRRRLDPDHGP